MKKQNPIWSSIGLLVGAVIANIALVPEDWQVWGYILIFGLWCIWAGKKFLFPKLRVQYRMNSLRRQRKAEQAQVNQESSNVATESPLLDVLMRHANHRITERLKSAYPDATWSWCEKYPENIVVSGGTGRIQLYGAGDYNFAEVTFDRNSNMKCSTLMIAALEKDANASADEDGQTDPPPKKKTDPQVWYEQQGREILENLISDLNAFGHNSLYIRENGDVVIKQADQEITKHQFADFPKDMDWASLVKMLERTGVAGEVQDNGILVTW